MTSQSPPPSKKVVKAEGSASGAVVGGEHGVGLGQRIVAVRRNDPYDSGPFGSFEKDEIEQQEVGSASKNGPRRLYSEITMAGRQHNPKPVCPIDVAPPHVPPQRIEGVQIYDGDEGFVRGGGSGTAMDWYGNDSQDTVGVRADGAGDVAQVPIRPYGRVRFGISNCGNKRADKAGTDINKNGMSYADVVAAGRPRLPALVGMDDGVEVGGRGRTHKSECVVFPGSLGGRLQGIDKEREEAATQVRPCGSHPVVGKAIEGVLPVDTQQACGETDKYWSNHATHEENIEARFADGSFDKEVCDGNSPLRCEEKSNPDAAGCPDGEALYSGPAPTGRNGGLRGQQVSPGVNERFNGSHQGAGPGQRFRAGFKGLPRLGTTVRATRLPMTDRERNSPLHSKPVHTLDINHLLNLAKGHRLEERLKYLLRFIQDPGMYDGDAMAEHVVSDVDDRDLTTMIADDLIEEVCQSDRVKVRRWCKFFTVFEQKKFRRRGILWPRQVNQELSYDCEIELLTLLEQMAQVTPGDVALAYDLTSSFHQFLLDLEVSYFFCFATPDGRVFRFKRGVMGFKPMAEVMNVVTEILASSQVLENMPAIKCSVHVDNVRYLGSHEKVAAAARVFTLNCEYVGATLNVEPELNVPHTSGEFCGVHYDYSAGTTCLPPAFINKLRDSFLRFKQASTIGTMAALFGCLFHASAVLRAPLCDYYHVLKWYRKTCSTFSKFGTSLTDTVSMWPAVTRELSDWLNFVLCNKPVLRPLGDSSAMKLFTDACQSGYAGVLFPGDGTVRVVAGKWSPLEAKRDISEKETMAADISLRAFAPALRNTKFQLHVDNSALLWGAGKGYSRSFNMNQRLGELRRTIRSIGLRFTIHYVQSKLNFADGPSRGQLTSLRGVTGGMKG